MSYAPPPLDVCESLMAWTAAHRPDCIPHPRPTPNVLYRVVATPAGRVYVSDLRTPRTVQRISVRDGDDEPWGDPVGYGRIPRRRRRTLLDVLWRVLTMKYRRVF